MQSRPLAPPQIKLGLKYRSEGKNWSQIARLLGTNWRRVRVTLDADYREATALKKKIGRIASIAPTDEDLYRARLEKTACDRHLEDLMAAYQRRPAPADPATERPHYVRPWVPSSSYCGSPAMLCVEDTPGVIGHAGGQAGRKTKSCSS